MAERQPREQDASQGEQRSGPSKVGMYDRPASADRPPMTIIIAVVVLLIASLLGAYLFFF